MRALEVCDLQRRARAGGAGPPRSGVKAEAPEREDGLLLVSKASPPCPPRSSTAQASPPRKREHKDREQRKLRSRSRRRRRRSPSPEKKKKRSKSPQSPSEEYIEEGEEEEDLETDPLTADTEDSKRTPHPREGGREETRQRVPPNRSPVRPKSPPGPPPVPRSPARPPPREEGDRHWEGPILAYRRRQEERPPIERRKPAEDKPKNKGVKKRRQQKRFKKNRHRIAAKRRY